MKNTTITGLRRFALIVTVSIMCLVSVSGSFAAENPYKDVEVDRAASEVVQEFNRFDFLESIVSAADGAVYATNLFAGIIYEIKAGALSELADIDGKLVGLTMLDDENLIATGANNRNAAIVIQVNVNTGAVKTIATIPGAMLLNGIAAIDTRHFLIADSLKGVIWQLDIGDGSVSIWLEHDILASPAVESNIPGVNGIKIRNNAAYISNTGKMILAKIPFSASGGVEAPEVIQQDVFIDDFTIGEAGDIFAATHIYDSIIKITPQGAVTIIAQADQGVIGSTCVAMQSSSQNTLLVSTNGGMLKADPSYVVPAKIVRLKQEF